LANLFKSANELDIIRTPADYNTWFHSFRDRFLHPQQPDWSKYTTEPNPNNLLIVDKAPQTATQPKNNATLVMIAGGLGLLTLAAIIYFVTKKSNKE
jgi:hypothetical protein